MPDGIGGLFGARVETINRYVDLLSGQGVEWGLIGPREVDRLWDRHILNSVTISSLIPTGLAVVDVGSGAGLPGIPLALARPDLRVTLLEPLLRRTRFLDLAVAELDLSDSVRVVRGRAEEHPERYDVVVARALAPLERLLGWCAPLLRPAGQMLLLKGRSAQDEVAGAASVLASLRLKAEVLTARISADLEPATVVRVCRSVG